ncbi:MAG: InlB B-repeat-containing protein [Oscillospiraceae bacterium]|nr:InlB B-repeat-containing protein [Oscillospiraceae bacterium]
MEKVFGVSGRRHVPRVLSVLLCALLLVNQFAIATDVAVDEYNAPAAVEDDTAKTDENGQENDVDDSDDDANDADSDTDAADVGDENSDEDGKEEDDEALPDEPLSETDNPDEQDAQDEGSQEQSDAQEDEAPEEQANPVALDVVAAEETELPPFSVAVDEAIENGTLTYTAEKEAATAEETTEEDTTQEENATQEEDDVWRITVVAEPVESYALKEGSLQYTLDGETYTEISADAQGVYSFTYSADTQDTNAGANADETSTTDDADEAEAEDTEDEDTATALPTITLTAAFIPAADTAWYYDNTSAKTYILTTPHEMLGLAELVNSEAVKFSGQTIQLGGDIDLSGIEWTAIGNATTIFYGTFDGCGFTIDNLTIEDDSYLSASTAQYRGLFGYIASSATIENLTLTGNVNGKSYCGSVVGYNAGLVSDVTSYVDIYVPADTTSRIGGIAGVNATGGEILNCVNYGDIEAYQAASASINVFYVGGIVGGTDGYGTIADCHNKGTINASVMTASQIGGVVGYLYAYSDGSCYVTRCSNEGDISYTCNLSTDMSITSNVGGVVGYAAGTYAGKGMFVDDCYNSGNITFDTGRSLSTTCSVGGLVGYGYTLLSGVQVCFTNCYNTGTITTDGTKASLAGSLVGNQTTAKYCYYTNCYSLAAEDLPPAGATANGTFSNNYYLGAENSDVLTLGGYARTLEWMKSASFISELLSNAYVYNEGTTPLLYWQKGLDEETGNLVYLNYNESSLAALGIETLAKRDTVVLTAIEDLTTPIFNTTYYKFVGWYDNAAGTGEAVDLTTVTPGSTLYAVWALADITVTYYDGTVDDSGEPVPYIVQTATYGRVLPELTQLPQKEGYVFVAWMTDSVDGDTRYDYSTIVTAPFALYAKWQAITLSNSDFKWYTDNPDAASFTIGNAAQMTALMYLVNGTTPAEIGVTGSVSFEGKTIVLACDINLDNVSWSNLIGERDAAPFQGTFDGNGYTISGTDLSIVDGLNKTIGLFGYTKNATFKNIKLAYNFAQVATATQVGALVVQASNTTFSNIEVTTDYTLATAGTSSSYNQMGGLVAAASTCSFDTVTVAAETNLTTDANYSYVGGIVGSGTDTTFINCSNSGSISGGTKTYVALGGIIALAQCSVSSYAPITGCSNQGAISDTATTAWVGGLIGKLVPGSSGTITIADCACSGTITGNASGSNAPTHGTGGIVGFCVPTTDTSEAVLTFENCTFSGTASVTSFGGIIGVSGTISYPLFTEFSDCNNNGTASKANTYVGGIAGVCYAFDGNLAVFENCTNDMQISGTGSCIGGMAGYGYCVYFNHCVNNAAISGSASSAGIVGNGAYQEMESCVNNGNITTTGMYCGGMAGSTTRLQIYKINNCVNNGAIKGTSYVGGMLGYSVLYGGISVSNSTNNGPVTGTSYVGGMVGAGANYSVSNCSNTADITGTSSYVGGIIGDATTGAISDSGNSGVVSGVGNIGGLAGRFTSGSIIACVNSGEVIGSGENVGGLAGTLGTADSTMVSVIRSYNEGEIKGDASSNNVAGLIGYSAYTRGNNCYNVGAVTVENDSATVGGLVADGANCYIENCYQGGAVTGGANVAAVYGGASSYIINCYYLAAQIAADATDSAKVTAADDMSGAQLAYLLDGGSATRAKAWTYIEEETHPTLADNQEIYRVTGSFTGDGTLTISVDGTAGAEYVKVGDTVVVTATPGAGSVLKSLALADGSGTQLYQLVCQSAAAQTYTYTVEAGNRVVSAVFETGTASDSGYEVEIVDGGDTVPTITESADGTGYTLTLSAPQRNGYTFAGWYLDEAFTIPYVAGTVFTDSTTLYGKWTLNSAAGGDGETQSNLPQPGDYEETLGADDPNIDVTITTGGTYTLAEGATGKIRIYTTETVKLEGNGLTYCGLRIYLAGDCTVIISNLNMGTASVQTQGGIDVAAKNNILYLEGENNFTSYYSTSGQSGNNAVHVPVGAALTIEAYTADGLLYVNSPVSSQAAIGGKGEDSGTITINSGTVALYHESQGGHLGSANNNIAATSSDSVFILNGGHLLIPGIINVTKIYVNGGTLSTFSSTLGKAADGTFISGGSISTVATSTSGGTVTSIDRYLMHNDRTAVTGELTDGLGDEVYPAVVPLAEKLDGTTTWDVWVDDTLFYSGKGHTGYVEENLLLNGINADTIDLAYDMSYTDEADAYLYLPGNAHVVTVQSSDGTTASYLATRQNTDDAFTLSQYYSVEFSYDEAQAQVQPGEGLSDEKIIADSFTFTAIAEAGYEITGVTVTNSVLAPSSENGYYTVTDITGDVVVTVTTKQLSDQYMFTYITDGHADIQEGNGVYDGIIEAVPFHFFAIAHTGYAIENVSITGGTLTDNGDDYYTVSDITDNVVATVTTREDDETETKQNENTNKSWGGSDSGNGTGSNTDGTGTDGTGTDGTGTEGGTQGTDPGGGTENAGDGTDTNAGTGTTGTTGTTIADSPVAAAATPGTTSQPATHSLANAIASAASVYRAETLQTSGASGGQEPEQEEITLDVPEPDPEPDPDVPVTNEQPNTSISEIVTDQTTTPINTPLVAGIIVAVVIIVALGSLWRYRRARKSK